MSGKYTMGVIKSVQSLIAASIALPEASEKC
jgi:hypothetical protein